MGESRDLASFALKSPDPSVRRGDEHEMNGLTEIREDAWRQVRVWMKRDADVRPSHAHRARFMPSPPQYFLDSDRRLAQMGIHPRLHENDQALSSLRLTRLA